MTDFSPIPPAPATDSFVVDFAAQLGGSGAPLTSGAWVVSVAPASPVADASAGSRILAAPTYSGSKTSARLGNMVAGCLYAIAVTVTSSDGRTLTESVGLECTSVGPKQALPSIGRMLSDARAMLNDTVPITGSTRYTDTDLLQAFNSALFEVRAKRPDAFLAIGLRSYVPMYDTADMAEPFPLNQIFYPLCVNYIVGKSELREDEFAAEGRAVAMLNKFVTGLLQVAS